MYEKEYGESYYKIVYSGYQPRSNKEGEIVHTKDGWFQVINGQDHYINEPPPGTIFWDQDNNNGNYGYYYKKAGWFYNRDRYLDKVTKHGIKHHYLTFYDTYSVEDAKLRGKTREFAGAATSDYGLGGKRNTIITKIAKWLKEKNSEPDDE